MFNKELPFTIMVVVIMIFLSFCLFTYYFGEF